ncbi:SH3 domain-containing protein [Thermomicrobium sp. 4228-Ro]|uniref:SH3 domain-containing protein n=1 Tax=Thermomicrobium sp. 4228-Ro TaxID=2993937 RepID=UPI002249A210|nr:SH3 domain-containing protein [Thermomicrobium sp. 4228-Ro]MCX2727429.1 SH3 domain-containing protein [Thermomicrobium sp. 4228-Ro]
MTHIRLCLLLVTVLVLTTGCRVPAALVASLPPTVSTLTVRTTLEQPFYSAADGLTAVAVRLNLPTSFGPNERPSLGGGAILRVFYAPEVDPRYPDNDFYAWPATQGWIGELLPSRVVEQTFLSRYPGLDGITVRVGTFGADVGTGIGRLREDLTALVREAPIAGRELASLAGGSSVEVLGSREGWIRVRLADGREGYIDRSAFAYLPEPVRKNEGTLVLRLYDERTGALLRESRLDVSTLTDESHVTFRFEPIADSYRETYRFTIEAVGSSPGHAVTLWGDPTSGDLVFRPSYAPMMLAEAPLDTGRWSGVEGTLEVRFAPIRPTRDTYLRIVIQAGDRPLIVHWSNVRPPGNLPLVSQDDPGIWGGVVFNARYAQDLPILRIGHDALFRAARLLSRDVPLLVGYFVVLSLVLAAIVWSWRYGGRRTVAS